MICNRSFAHLNIQFGYKDMQYRSIRRQSINIYPLCPGVPYMHPKIEEGVYNQQTLYMQPYSFTKLIIIIVKALYLHEVT